MNLRHGTLREKGKIQKWKIISIFFFVMLANAWYLIVCGATSGGYHMKSWES
jgi:hypothetical protein